MSRGEVFPTGRGALGGSTEWEWAMNRRTMRAHAADSRARFMVRTIVEDCWFDVGDVVTSRRTKPGRNCCFEGIFEGAVLDP